VVRVPLTLNQNFSLIEATSHKNKVVKTTFSPLATWHPLHIFKPIGPLSQPPLPPVPAELSEQIKKAEMELQKNQLYLAVKK
tara:strand:+ start:318 stop:563 length:246 start_codon:yes stop_codon:yes gene_type:complete